MDPDPLWPTIVAAILLVAGPAIVALAANPRHAWIAAWLDLTVVVVASFLLLIPGQPLENLPFSDPER